MTSLRFSNAARRLTQVACLSALTGVCAFGGLVTFSGEDLNAGPGGPFTNSNAAAALFMTAAGAIGNVATITFEGAAVGGFNSLGIASGVTATAPAGIASINNVPNLSSAPSLDGFNTTPGGSKYIEDLGGSITFTFTTPTQFFGTYLTGTQIAFFQDTVTFNDGTSQTINVNQTGTSNSVGAVDFIGFTDVGKSITSITINAGGPTTGEDFIGIDDLSYQTSAAPEPGTFGLVGLAMGAFFGIRRMRRS